MKIWVQRAANYVRRVDDGPYGIEESDEPKDTWWEEVEMQEADIVPDWAKAAAEARRERGEPPLAATMPRNAAGDYVLYDEDGI